MKLTVIIRDKIFHLDRYYASYLKIRPKNIIKREFKILVKNLDTNHIATFQEQ